MLKYRSAVDGVEHQDDCICFSIGQRHCGSHAVDKAGANANNIVIQMIIDCCKNIANNIVIQILIGCCKKYCVKKTVRPKQTGNVLNIL